MNAIVQQDGSLERLLTELEFDIHGLVECRISAGWRVSLPTIGLCGICYVSGAPCRMIAGRSPPVLLPPNSVAIVPSGKSLLLQGPGGRPPRTLSLSQSEMAGPHAASASEPVIAGDDRTTNVIYISFRAYWGLPRLVILQDPAINRVFSEMVALPGAQYSVATLSEKACLSRSAFMVRFVAAVGAPPFVVLRELRMRRAAELLAAEAMTIDQVARAVGYGSRSSFARAFRIVYGVDVSVHRQTGVVTHRTVVATSSQVLCPVQIAL